MLEDLLYRVCDFLADTVTCSEKSWMGRHDFAVKRERLGVGVALRCWTVSLGLLDFAPLPQ